MNAKEWAAKLNGRQYRDEIEDGESDLAKADGVLIIFGYSDDNVEFRGVIHDEIGAYNGTTIFIASGKRVRVLPDHDDCECEFCGFKAVKATAKKIEALWGEGSVYAWQFQTDVPHETFEILEDDEKFCLGIVIAAKDLE